MSPPRGAAPLRIFAVSLLLSVCAHPTAAQAPTSQPPAATAPLSTITKITVDWVSYPTAAAALEALSHNYTVMLDKLTPATDPLKGQARVVVPDRDRLRPLVSQQLTQQLKRPVIGEALDYKIDQARLEIRAMADALMRSQAFETASIVEQNDTRNPDIGDADYLVWFQVRTASLDNTGAWLGRWLVRRAGRDTATGAAMDPGVPPGTARFSSFVKSVRDGIARLGGSPVAAGAGAQTTGDGGRRTVSSGSGIIVDAEGHVATNDHVVRDCTALRVTDSANASQSATIAAHDTVNDLAVLKAEHRWPSAAAIRDGREARPGDSVVVTGYPLSGVVGSGMAVTTGSLTALTGPSDDSRLLQVSAPVQPGNSGGPLLDGSGGVIGVVTGTLNGTALAIKTGVVPQNVNFAIKSAVLRNFLDTNGIAYVNAAGQHKMAAAAIGDLARKFTVRVECQR